MKFSAILLLALITSILHTGLLSAQSDGFDTTCYSTKWPHELSDLQPNHSLHYGRLYNGFRYVLKSNREPKDRVALYLNVEAGSLYEQDAERGLAHFLEHLLFNGTTHFKPGELIDYFQSIGMSFGGDVNGYTTYTDSVYKLILPDGSLPSLDQGFLVMRDYADGALLLAEEIERERGVIAAEKTARDSAGYRSRLARTSFIFHGTPVPDRQPIGDDQVLTRSGRDELISFYRRWYRPDNMVLAVVGDFEQQGAENLVRKHFGSMTVAASGICPQYGHVDHNGIKTFYHYEPELGKTNIFIETVTNKEPENDSLELQRENIIAYMASLIINHRLSRLQESVTTPFSAAGYYDTTMFDRFRITGIRARTTKETWRESLAEINRVLQQISSYGFHEDEVQRVKKDLLADLENAVLSAETVNSSTIIGKILTNLDANRVLQSPQQELELFGPVIETVSTGDLHRAVRQRWHAEDRLVQVVGDAVLSVDDKENELLSFYRQLQEEGVEAPEDNKPPAFPYLARPESASEPLKTERFEDIEVVRHEFANGLILNLKSTDFRKNEVRAALHFGDGLKSVPRKGLDLLAAALVNGSGTATLKKSQLQESLAGTSVQYRFGVGEESFVLEGQAVSSELELLFQVMQALLDDPGFRQSVYTISMKNFESMYRGLSRDIAGGARLHLDSFFGGNALGLGLPSWDEFASLTLADVTGWLKPYFKRAPLELSVVGEFDPEQVLQLAARYFDQVGDRTYGLRSEPKANFPTGKRREVDVETSVDKALLRFGWLTDDYHDISRTRRLHVLAAVIEDRLRRKIREELGKAYSPSAYSISSRIYPGYGVLYADLVVDNESIPVAENVLEDVENSFAERPVAQEELLRAREPIVTSLKDALRTNSYWLYSVLSLSSRNEDLLAWPTTLISDFSSINPEQINAMVARYIRSDRRAAGLVRSVGDSGN